MKRALALALAAALTLPGCAPARVPAQAPGPTPALPSAAASLGTPVAAIVEFGRYSDNGRKIRRVGVDGTLTTLPVDPFADSDLALSAGGGALLYTPTPSNPPTVTGPGWARLLSRAEEVRSLDVSSGVTRVVFRGPAVTYGFDSAGRTVILSGRGPENAMRFMPGPGPVLVNLELFTISGSRYTSRSVDASAFSSVTDLRFLAADNTSVYLAGTSLAGLHGIKQSIWSLDRATGRATPLAKYPDGDWAPIGERRPWLSEWLTLPADRVLRDGLPMLSTVSTGYMDPAGAVDNATGKRVPVETQYGVATAIELYRLPDMTVARSIVVTQPPGWSAFVSALSPDLTRSLVQLDSVSGFAPPQPILERGPSGEGTITVPQSIKSRPAPIGYIGDDIVYSFYRAPSSQIALWQRKTRTARVIGALPAGESDYHPVVIGVQYER